MKILVTGSAGFIGGYIVQELLSQGHTVCGIDNFSKYGNVSKNFDSHKRYNLIKGDAKNVTLLKNLIGDCDHVIAAAAKIGGIGYFHEYPYDLLAENERIIATTFDAAIDAFQNQKLQKITVVSSSMVYESALEFPTREDLLQTIPPPKSTYGFQKLACEYFAKGAYEQYGLPYTIARPFNCVGIGETGSKKQATSHVVPDLVKKVLEGQNPLHILGDGKQTRCYTYGGDVAKGIVAAMFSPKAKLEDFNISTNEATTVLELAKRIWKKINGEKPFKYVSDKPFFYDVRMRKPDTRKAKKLLNFVATTTLDTMLDEVISYMRTV